MFRRHRRSATTTSHLVRIVPYATQLVGPMLGQRVAFIQTHAARKAFWEWEMWVHKQAEQGHVEAQRIAPEGLRQWVKARASTLGVEGEALPSWQAQYIDDSNAHSLGRARAVKHLLINWRLAKKFKLPRAEGKTQLGEVVTILGISFYGPQGLMAVSEAKKFLLQEWWSRINHDSFTSWELEEARSLIGTLSFCVEAAQGARKLLRSCFRYIHNKKIWKRKWGGQKWGRIPAYIKQAIESTITAIVNSNGAPVISPTRPGRELPGVPQIYTDSNRNRSGKFSGMAGVLKLGPEIHWWNYKLPPDLVDTLPVHVTELLSDVLSLFIWGPNLRGQFVQTWIDNMAALYAIQSENSADPRFQILIILRHFILEFYQLDTSSDYVRSKDNTLADPASRGELDKLYAELAKQNSESIHQIDFPTACPTDFDQLLNALVVATVNMKSRTKSNDFVP